MASGNGGVVQFTPVNTGDMTEIPPDLPAGAWQATCSVKKAKTSKEALPMLICEWKTDEALTDGNEDAVGARVTDFVVFYPGNHRASRMSKIRLKTMCEALGIDIPSVTKVNTWDDLADFIAELDGCKATIYTTVEERKDTGEMVSKVSYRQPGSKLAARAASEEDDEDDAPPPPKKSKLGPNGRPLKKKSN